MRCSAVSAWTPRLHDVRDAVLQGRVFGHATRAGVLTGSGYGSSSMTRRQRRRPKLAKSPPSIAIRICTS